MRLFTAVFIGNDAVRSIRAALDDFPVARPPWRWTQPAAWHITLKFIGETSPSDLGRVVAALEGVAPRHVGFDLALGPFGGFPSLRAPRVLFFAAASGAEPCAALAADVDAALFAATGLARETRRFHAHATVARVKQAPAGDIVRRLALVPPLTDAVTRVDGFALVESRLQRTGALYSTVKQFAFSGNGC